tara:strand:- start:172 stop:558 length:387 start_codon:yes stop_codon:yes gene_type:complete
MQVDTFFKLSDEFLAECKDIQVEKGREYTVDSSDKFKNFKSIGDRLGMDAKMVALVYMLKHMDSIRAYILSGKEGSEGLKGRCQDLVNYAIMLWAMDHEEKEYIKLEKDIDANGEDLTYFNKLKKLHA